MFEIFFFFNHPALKFLIYTENIYFSFLNIYFNHKRCCVESLCEGNTFAHRNIQKHILFLLKKSLLFIKAAFI